MSEGKQEIKFNYGGQAVMEGVMMRGAHIFAVAVRDPKGGIAVHKDTIPAALYRGRISRTPFVRGVMGLWDAMGLGIRALMWSADVALSEEEAAKTPEQASVEHPLHQADTAQPVNQVAAAQPVNQADTAQPVAKGGASFSGPVGWITVAVALAFSFGLFFFLPTAASAAIGEALGLQEAPFLVNVIEGFIQLFILIAYISVVGLMPDMRRVFSYHGAEHKTINAYEAGAELTPKIVQNYPIEHPRCGTAFLLLVVFVSIFVFGFFGRPPFLLLILSRVLLVPVIAGIAYEVLRWTAANLDKPWVRVIVKPNLALQHLTTRQPSLEMLEVAIVAFKHVLVSEGLLDASEVAETPVTTQNASGLADAVPAVGD